ncbi:MAG: antibiotic biosynthesis monooxygenase [Methanobacterium sp. ERen5]|nr:MAG: antibiotic biosynthesis monooxygenase [Methanobacterium sp. ERen5]
MIYLMAIQKVEDFNRWKEVFDKHSTKRRVMGSKGAEILRDSNRPNEIVVITKWEDEDTAKKFSSSNDLKKVMKKAGVVGFPELRFLDDIKQTEH